MSIIDKLRRPAVTTDELPSANPSAEEYAQQLSEVQATGPDFVRQREAQEVKEHVLRQATEAGRLLVHGSEVSGQVPIITADTPRPKD